MTLIVDIDMKPRVGRKKLWHERAGIKFARGTFARIAAVLEPGEVRMDLVRTAVERELKRREATKRLGRRKPP
jgi:hypothetical protein